MVVQALTRELAAPAPDCAGLAEQWLAEAYELVSAGWCSGLAQDEEGRSCEPDAPTAARWSASGAVVAAWRRSSLDEGLGLEALQRANLALTAAVNDVPRAWNDAPGRRQHEVAEALLHAVSLVNDPALFGRASRGETFSPDGFDRAA